MGKFNFLSLFEYFCLCCVCIVVLCEAAILPKCEDSDPPCVYEEITTQPVCEESSDTVNIVFKLLQSVLQMIPPENISAMHLDKTIMQGTQLKDFLSNAENRDRWEIAMLYKAELLEIQVSNNFIQKGDSFHSQFVLDMGSHILETSPSIWFIVEDCSKQLTTKTAATASTNTSPGKDTLNEELIHTLAVVQELLKSRNLTEMENSSMTHIDRRYSDIDSTRLYQLLRADIAFSVIGVILISYTAWLTTMSSYCSWKRNQKEQKGISPQSVPLTTNNAGNGEGRNEQV